MNTKETFRRIIMKCNGISILNDCEEPITRATKLTVLSKYGLHEVSVNRLLHRINPPTITSATNKNAYFTNVANEVHQFKYDYSNVNYVLATKPVEIVCSSHGSFFSTPDKHINSGTGCPTCGNRHTTEQFIIKARKVHGDLYQYNKTTYISCYEKVKITCNVHGDFLQAPQTHLMGNHKSKGGSGCQKCAAVLRGIGFSRSDFLRVCERNNAGFGTLYVIKCYNDVEEFYKIGITSRTVNCRFAGNELPYNYEITNELKGSANDVYDLEKILHRMYINLGYHYNPQIEFGGMTECFKLKD